MKNFWLSGRQIITGLIAFMLIFIIKPGKSQDTDSSNLDKKATVKLKIVNTKNGKTVVLDTTIYSDIPFDREELGDLMDDLREEMKSMKNEFEDIDLDMDVDISSMDEMDSLGDGDHKVIVIGKDGKKGKIRIGRHPDGVYQYKYDYDCDSPRAFRWYGGDGLGEFDFGIPLPPDVPAIMRYGGKNQGTLNDLLGDIPMDRVKNYQIKEKKNGKRIIIDLENGPLVETRDNMVIVRSDRKPVHLRYRHPAKRVKVIVEPGKPEAPATPRTPEPPAPTDPAKKQGTGVEKTDKPRI